MCCKGWEVYGSDWTVEIQIWHAKRILAVGLEREYRRRVKIIRFLVKRAQCYSQSVGNGYAYFLFFFLNVRAD